MYIDENLDRRVQLKNIEKKFLKVTTYYGGIKKSLMTIARKSCTKALLDAT
jgi:hypothetical protein